MKKDVVKNIAHITVNSKDVVVYPDDSVIFDEMKPVMRDMVEQAKETGIVSVMDSIFGSIKVHCVLDLVKGAYMASLYYEEAPEMLLLETAGALNAEAGKEIWEYMRGLYKVSWEKNAPDIKCPKEPFICDLLFPNILLTPWITRWTGDFTKCFGISILNMMLQYKKIMEMEEISNRSK
ncbi:MAG: hypothetical protein K2N34_00690 [Lachnospiraceae bacterium]|nr:hypothetical protein [Lachnospiraceae bacterium]